MPSSDFESDDDNDKNTITTPPLTPSHDDENSYSSPTSTKDKNRTPSPQHTPPYTPDHNNDDDDGMDNGDSSKKEENTESKTPVWTAYLDDSQRTYYYNSVTGESVWEAPVGEPFIPVQGEESGAANTTTDGDVDNENETQANENSNETKQDKNDDSNTPAGTPTGTPSGTPLGTPVGSPAAYSDDGGGITPEHDNAMDDTKTDDNKETSNVNETWVAYKDDNGAEYYYNTVTQATQWEKPEGMLSDENIVDNEQDKSTSAMDTNDNYDNQQINNDESTNRTEDLETNEETDVTIKNQTTENEEKEKEEEIVVEDPTEKTIREANEFVDAPDAIFEPACNKHVSKIIELQGQSGGSDMMIKLISSYRGHSSICGLLALWLMDLTTATNTNSSTTSQTIDNQKTTSSLNVDNNTVAPTSIDSNMIDVRNKAATSIRQLSEKVIYQLAKNNFTKTAGDEILDIVTSSRKIRFLEDMIDSDSWRSLLIDLSATNKDSALLMGCLRQISKRGHNREIAQRIDQSDYFGVLNAMLASELSILGKIAVGGVLDSSKHGDDPSSVNLNNNSKNIEVNDIEELVFNVKKICLSTAYSYFFAMKFLQQLVQSAKDKKVPEGPKAVAKERAIRKWERLREELEAEMVRPKSTGTESHIAKRRRVDTALTLSDLFQRQRRRKIPSFTNDDKEHSNDKDKLLKDPVEQKLDSALIDLLRRHSLGIQIDENVADNLLVPHTLLKGQESSIGELLIAHPSSIKALMINLFKPAHSRVMSLNLRQKCSKLLAKAIIASEKTFDIEKNNNGESEDEEEIRLWKMILQGSQLCKDVENMVSFTVTDFNELPHHIPDNSSTGVKLSYLSIKSAPVAQGVLLWINELASGPDFESSAAYPTLSPSLLSLARVIAKYHPFARPEVLNLTFLFLKHKAPELTYEKLKALKHQILRLLLWLCTWGQALGVFGFFAKRLKKGGVGEAEIDSSMLRYFLGGVLEIIHPPLSVPLVNVLCNMLGTKACIDAVISPHFQEKKKIILRELLNEFEKTYKEERQKSKSACSVSDRDMRQMDILKNMYS